MLEPSESVAHVVTYLDVAAFALFITVLAFAGVISRVMFRVFPGLALDLAELCLLIEVKQENFGGKSYYSRTLKQYVKRKKIFELADELEYKVPSALRVLTIACVYIYFY